ncbi:MAG: SMC-Scp complex subunit ScpB [Candidatus Bathyarchaeota archaeon]|nr:MAG: SMC-Scp complex subunit ScpB [Candidatus Bathyarchaeota archaeon]
MQRNRNREPVKKDDDAAALLEAALYVSGRPLNLKTLSSIVKIRSKKKIKALTKALAEKYKKRGSALELIEIDNSRLTLQLVPKYISLVKRLVVRPLLSKGPLKTLAYIAYRQPIVQSQVVAVRGSHSYSHIKHLKKLGLLTTEKLGKTKIIRTTDVFADYFNLSHDPQMMRRQIKTLFDAVHTQNHRTRLSDLYT